MVCDDMSPLGHPVQVCAPEGIEGTVSRCAGQLGKHKAFILGRYSLVPRLLTGPASSVLVLCHSTVWELGV